MDQSTRALTVQFLEWLLEHPRSYAETMEAWRTSCPRFPIWEDAVDDGFVVVEEVGGRSFVRVTNAGLALLKGRAGTAQKVGAGKPHAR
jgi:hypothetical protein